jgi:hypothetical protein
MTKSLNPSRDIFSPQVQKQIKDLLEKVGDFKAEVDHLLKPYRPLPQRPSEPTQILEQLFLRFHVVAKQLQKRQRKKDPFYIRDEYDVQDLLHALLRISFSNIKPEEYCPSYAETSSKIDFLLKQEKIAVEAKMANKDHGSKKISKELILDKEYYSKNKDVRILYCLVYDPEEVILNPCGFETDLYEKGENFEAKVFVIPRRA